MGEIADCRCRTIGEHPGRSGCTMPPTFPHHALSASSQAEPLPPLEGKLKPIRKGGKFIVAPEGNDPLESPVNQGFTNRMQPPDSTAAVLSSIIRQQTAS